MGQQHILMVIDHYLPIQGGAQYQTQRLSQSLAQRGHKVSVVTVWQTGLPEVEDDNGIKVYRIKGLTLRVPWFFKEPGWRRYPPPFPDPGLVLELRRLIGRLHPDVIQVYGWMVYSCAVALLGKHIPMVVSARDYGYSCANRYMMHGQHLCDGPGLLKCTVCARDYYSLPKALAATIGIAAWRRLLINKTGAFHSVSTFVQQILDRDVLRTPVGRQNPSGPNALSVVIHDLFEEQEATADPAYMAQLPDEPFILFVGTLDQRKGMDVLLRAYAMLGAAPPLVLIGITTPDTPATFPPGVTVLRNVPHPTVMAAWHLSLFGVAPSVVPDCLPNVVLEAMSEGKAVVGTNIGGIPDMILDGGTGLLVPPGDDLALAAAIERLSNDPALRERLGRAAQLRVQLFSPTYIVPHFESLYARLAGGNNVPC